MRNQDVLNRILENEVSSDSVKGVSALVISKGEELYFHACGYANVEKKQPMQRDTIIRLFSMSKPITACAVMICQEKGLLDLNDPVSSYLPEFGKMRRYDDQGNLVDVNTPITIMHLLTMTSGIPYGENWEGCSRAGMDMQVLFDQLLLDLNEGKRHTTRQMAEMIAKMPLSGEPGTCWGYGLSADILGAVVEVVTGMRYGAFLKKEIFDPLQMPDTGFFVPKEKWDRFAMSYELDWNTHELVARDDSHLCEYYHEDVAFESGGAGMVSTIDDYSHFAQMLAAGGTFRGKRILGPKTVRFMSTNHLTKEQAGALDWDSNRGYGYGCLMRVLIDQGKAGTQAPLGEFGWDGWTGNYVCMDPEDNLVFLYFIQKRGSGTTPAARKARAAIFSALD